MYTHKRYDVKQLHIAMCSLLLDNKDLWSYFDMGLYNAMFYERVVGESIPYLVVIRNVDRMLDYKRDFFITKYIGEGLTGQTLWDTVDTMMHESGDPPPSMYMRLEDWWSDDGGHSL